MNDLISRSALLEEATRSFDAFIHGAYFRAACDAIRAKKAVVRMLNDAPAVDAEVVRHGRWVAVENTGLEEWCAPPIRCSNCSKTMPDVGADFCPFCGQMNVEVER